MTSTAVRIGLATNLTGPLEFVEQFDEIAAIHRQAIGKVALRQPAVLIKASKHEMNLGRKPSVGECYTDGAANNPALHSATSD